MLSMKKCNIVFVISLLVLALAACNSSAQSLSQTNENSQTDHSSTDNDFISAPPGVEFYTADEAVREIRSVKKAGPEKMDHPNDFKIYEK